MENQFTAHSITTQDGKTYNAIWHIWHGTVIANLTGGDGQKISITIDQDSPHYIAALCAAQEADSIRLGAIRYTDDMLRSLQTIIGHALDGSRSRYDALQADLQSSLDIVSSNRKELAQGMPKDDGINIPQ